MPEAWELSPDQERKADEIVTFIIFCEDGVCEPFYFKSLSKPGKVQINVPGDQKSGFRNITNALLHCEANGLLENHGGGYRIKHGVTQHIWSVFDRDTNTAMPALLPTEDMIFSQSIHTAEHAGIKVAWSNDAFELWLLLHFEDVDPGIPISRQEIYLRLTNYLKLMPAQSPEMIGETSKPGFNYKGSFKKRNEFNLFVLPLLEPNRIQAEQRAALLVGAFNATHAYHQRNPCTHIQDLVNSILSFH